MAVRLVNAQDGIVLWSDTYERGAKDVFAVQDDITDKIVTVLKVTMGTNPASSARSQAGTQDLRAYDLYLHGLFFLHQRGTTALKNAAARFQSAIGRDPQYARAYAGLADATALLPIYGDTPADSAFPAARRAAEQAIALDSTLVEAHTTLGLILRSTGDWAGSERAFARAITLDPGYAPAHQWRSELFTITGRVSDAVVEMRMAQRLDPLSPVIAAELSYTLGLAGQYEEAYADGKRAVQLEPNLWVPQEFLGYAELFGGRPAAIALAA